MILGVIMNPDKTPTRVFMSSITFLIRTFDVFVVTVTAKQVQQKGWEESNYCFQ